MSFEEQINNYKAYYYKVLRLSSVGWETGENDYFPFIEKFLSSLYMCYKELDKRFAVVHGKKITKKTRVEVTVLNSLTPLSKTEVCKIPSRCESDNCGSCFGRNGEKQYY